MVAVSFSPHTFPPRDCRSLLTGDWAAHEPAGSGGARVRDFEGMRDFSRAGITIFMSLPLGDFQSLSVARRLPRMCHVSVC